MRMLLASLGMLLIGGAVLGQVVQLGDHFGIGNEPSGFIHQPAVAMDSAGNFIVVWGGEYQDHIGAQLFDAEGSKLGDEFQVNTYTSSSQLTPEVAVDDAGHFFVVWVSELEDGDARGIQGRRFDSSGGALDDPFQINTYTTNSQVHPEVSFDAAGNSVVVWTSRDQGGCGDGIFGQRFDAGGDPSGNEFQINVNTSCSGGGSRGAPDVAKRPGGDFLVAWSSTGEDGFHDILGRLFGSDGNPQGGEFQINTDDYSYYEQIAPAIGMAPSGEFVVAWNSYYFSFPHPYGGVAAQRFDASGGKIGGQFDVDPIGSDHTRSPEIGMAPDGEFVVAWTKFDFSGLYDFDTEIFARRFDSEGLPMGEKFQVNNDRSYDQWHPTVAMGQGPSHPFVVAWRDQSYPDSNELVGQRFADAEIFSDGFESGDATAWSVTEP